MKDTSVHLTRCLLAAAVAALPGLGMAATASDSPMTPGAEALAAPQPEAVGRYVLPATVFRPESSVRRAADRGLRVHTNFVVHNRHGIQVNRLEDLAVPEPEANPGPNASTTEYPASLACIAKAGPNYSGCAPVNNAAYNATGGSRVIVIVDAYETPTAAADLAYFSTYFGLPAAKFKKVIANGNGACVTPPTNTGWALETALDLQYAHAMAPGAHIVLVEACSNSWADMMYAEQIAIQQANSYGGGQISNSWGGAEWSTESADWDWVFRSNWLEGKTVSFFFSAGDNGLGAQWPSSSPWVTSVGGTTINRDATTKAFQSESCWPGSGGGTSAYETWGTTFGTGTGPWTGFQYAQFGPSARRTPDISFAADPASGAYVYSAGAWYVVGGTSLSAPLVAGLVNGAGNRLGLAPSAGGYFGNMENNLLYAQLHTAKEYANNFYDVTTGSNGASATVGWDQCTGVGSPRGRLGK
ncbi:MAG TPA: S53 family peptidase [Ideonella sp.]|uniref:S53 family peptidase n=1 Tax=Ideonella sp. TaxID=1929293 RepID=UPI002CE7FA75|nr:S53 family peptidase [Ideonella sp.]HSI52077.1 S53 family peptidase [Ideonella sp.]